MAKPSHESTRLRAQTPRKGVGAQATSLLDLGMRSRVRLERLRAALLARTEHVNALVVDAELLAMRDVPQGAEHHFARCDIPRVRDVRPARVVETRCTEEDPVRGLVRVSRDIF